MASSKSDKDLRNDIEKLETRVKEQEELISNLMENLDARLSNSDINRYSRQILVPHVGVEGQLFLKQSSVLIVGAGGLGSPCSLYLASSGVGHIGIIDYDVVEMNNLHRQIIHSEESVGQNKVESAVIALKRVNSNIKVTPYHVLLNSSNAMSIVSKFDIVVDATDNVATRYLINDACVLLSKPLVSGSALQMEGQLTVYNYQDGPCYRCLFPVPPSPSTVTNCGDGGVLSVIPGTIGILQALETIKIILHQEVLAGYLLLFDGVDTSFRKVRLRPRNKNCDVCGDSPTVKALIDYEQFCKAKMNDKNPNLKLLPESKRISVEEYDRLKTLPHILVDVRTEEEFKICRLPGSLNAPINKISSSKYVEVIQNELLLCRKNSPGKEVPVFVVCRRGNDSQKAVLQLEKQLIAQNQIKDIVGGLHAWTRNIDRDFPIY